MQKENCPKKVQPLLIWDWFAQHWCNLSAKDSGLAMHMCEQRWLHCTISEVSRRHWVGMCTVWLSHSKWLSKWNNKSASNFALSLNIPLWQLNYSDDSEGHSYGQLVIGSFITTWYPFTHHILCSVLATHQITQVTQPRYSPDSAPCDFWLFWKLKSPLKGKKFQTVDEIQENMTEQLMAIGRTVWGPKVPTLKGDWGIIVLCTMILVSSSINVCIFHFIWLDTFWTDDYTHTHTFYNIIVKLM